MTQPAKGQIITTNFPSNGTTKFSAAPPNSESPDHSARPVRSSQSCVWAALIGLTALGSLEAIAETGTVDPSFKIGTGITGSFVHNLAVSSQGKVLVVGSFTRAQGAPCSNVAQLNADGSLDDSFKPAPGANNQVLGAVYQADGKALIAGIFTRVNNVPRNRIARLNTDGSLDNSFNVGTGADGEVRCLAVQPDGKILLAGPFIRYNGSSCNGVARLQPDGSLDTSFSTGTGVGGERWVDEVRVLNDGKILIAGDFPTYNGVKRASIARLNSDGSLDLSFDPGTGAKPGDPILDVAFRPDGKIVVVGSFIGFNRATLNNIAQLNPDGSLDSSFNPGSGTSGGPVNGMLESVALEPDGKILIGGWFDKVNGVSRPYLARLLPGGKPDTNWNVRVDAQVRSLRIQPDHKVLFAGDFTKVNTLPSARLARMNASTSSAGVLWNFHAVEGQMRLQFVGEPGRKYLLQTSDDLAAWQTWTTASSAAGPTDLTDLDAGNRLCRFFRALPTE